MVEIIFETLPLSEVLARKLLNRFPNLKGKVKTRLKQRNSVIKGSFNADAWNEYQKQVKSVINNDSIILVHSSMDGLNAIGVTVEQVLDFLISFLEMGCTVVIPAYAASSYNIKNGRIGTYNPDKSPCWTGMLPNYFIRLPEAIRTVFPYNSLAAIGPHAEEMMAENDKQEYVYGDYSAWKYCVDHNATIIFLGTTSLESNTIQTHMIADIMKDEWPIKDWYQTVSGIVKVKEKRTEKSFKVQKNEWSRFVADYHITKKLKKANILNCCCINGCPFEYIIDSKYMVDYLIDLVRKGNNSYIVPKKFYK